MTKEETKKAWFKRYRTSEKGKKARKEALQRHRERYPEKAKARKIVEVALKFNKITRGICKCGNTKVEAHHDDYSKPLEIQWLCRSCHMKLHWDIKRKTGSFNP